MALFQDEPDELEEDTGPGLFGIEPAEEDRCRAPFEVEADEVTHAQNPFQVEPDEPDFVAEVHQDGSESGESAYMADVDEDTLANTKAYFDMSFSTLSQFLENKFIARGSDTAAAQPPTKKRCYDNTRRAARAEASRATRAAPEKTRVPRNDKVAKQIWQDVWFSVLCPGCL